MTCIWHWKYTISGTLLGVILYINMLVCNSFCIIINSTHDSPCSVYVPHYEQKQSIIMYVPHTVQVTVHLSPLNKRSKQTASLNQQRVITSHPSTFTSISGLLNVSFVVISSLSIACVISQTFKKLPWKSEWLASGLKPVEPRVFKSVTRFYRTIFVAGSSFIESLKQFTSVSNRVLILMLFTG